MIYEEHPKVRSKKLRDSARMEACSFQIPDVCTYNDEETVLCHFNVLGDKGMATKASDLSAAYGCSACHYALDNHLVSHEDFLFYTRRGIVRTIHRMAKNGYLDDISKSCAYRL